MLYSYHNLTSMNISSCKEPLMPVSLMQELQDRNIVLLKRSQNASINMKAYN